MRVDPLGPGLPLPRGSAGASVSAGPSLRGTDPVMSPGRGKQLRLPGGLGRVAGGPSTSVLWGAVVPPHGSSNPPFPAGGLVLSHCLFSQSTHLQRGISQEFADTVCAKPYLLLLYFYNKHSIFVTPTTSGSQRQRFKPWHLPTCTGSLRFLILAHWQGWRARLAGPARGEVRQGVSSHPVPQPPASGLSQTTVCAGRSDGAGTQR